MKHLRYILLILALGIGTQLLPQSDAAQQKLELANTYYSKAIYDSAIITYHKVLDAAYESVALYYNLGNTYFKLRNFPSAILYYEKARKLDPSDPDILFNLEVANGSIVDKIDPLPQMFYRIWWNRFYAMFDADTWAWLSVILFLLTLFMGLLYLVSNRMALRKLGFFVGIFFLFLTVGTFGMASQKYYYTQQTNEAIVFTPTITVKSSPAANSVDLFVLHEGSKVLLLDEVGNWRKIKIANGSIGWLPEESIQGI
jgi:tetratricopeptide (TPR) repeat protein